MQEYGGRDIKQGSYLQEIQYSKKERQIPVKPIIGVRGTGACLVMPALKRLSQEAPELEAILDYIANLKPAWATKGDIVSKKAMIGHI
jgi:hypothetical protein